MRRYRVEIEHTHIIKIFYRRTAVFFIAVLNFLYRFGKVNINARLVFGGFFHNKLKIASVGGVNCVRSHHKLKAFVAAVGTHIV